MVKIRRFQRMHIWSGILVLVAFCFITLVYYYHHRFSVLRPNPWVWAALTGANLVSVAYCTWTAIRLFKKKVVFWPLGWFLLVTTPLALTASLGWELAARAHARENIDISNLGILTCYGCGAGEFEAWSRYPRRVKSKHIELIDANTTPAAETLTAQLDNHVERMANLLGQPVPKGHIAWVRGKLLSFGKNGRAIRSLAICGEGPGELTSQDYHEVAHALIYRMVGPEGCPPMLLVEGWAQCHSAASVEEDRMNAIRGLAGIYAAGDSVPLRSLVSPEYYGRSYGPVYIYGAPFTIYLLEEYGGEAFFRLYRECSQPTFFHDVRKILGIDWLQLEDDFWKWFKAEFEKLPAEVKHPKNQRHPIAVGEGVDTENWSFILNNVASERFSAELLPKQFAFQMTESDRDGSMLLQFVRESESSFLRWETNAERHRFSQRSPTKRMSLDLKGNRLIETETLGESMESYVARQHDGAIGYIAIGCVAQKIELDDDFKTPLPLTVTSIEGPLSTSLWKVALSQEQGDETFVIEYLLDADQNWRAIKSEGSRADGAERFTEEVQFMRGPGPRYPKTIIHKWEEQNGSLSSTSSLRILTNDESREIKADVVHAIAKGPAPITWLQRLRNRYDSIVASINGPFVLKYGWPSFAAVFLVGSRIRKSKSP
ncbi:MAG: hypothetical protein KDA87_11885 [Planctomycetales bacterium]|nr:hypothetical protein [Planctomycetales bacterium]